MQQATSASRFSPPSSQGGFTLIELIMVIVILGVLAVFAAPRMFDTAAFQARGFHDETLSLLRYAQKTAIAQRRAVCVTVNDTGLALSIDSNSPADGNCDISLSPPSPPRGGTGLSASVAGFRYSALGSTNQTAVVSISISNASSISVEAATGYVHD